MIQRRAASAGQKRQLWWLAERVLGPIWREDEDFRHGVVEKATSGRALGMSGLDQWGAQDVFRYLIEYGKNARRNGHPVLATDAQQRKIYKQAYELGLATPAPRGSRRRADTRRLRAWLKRMFKTDKPIFLLYEEADRAIEGLKEMFRRGERYGAKAREKHDDRVDCADSSRGDSRAWGGVPRRGADGASGDVPARRHPGDVAPTGAGPVVRGGSAGAMPHQGGGPGAR